MGITKPYVISTNLIFGLPERTLFEWKSSQHDRPLANSYLVGNRIRKRIHNNDTRNNKQDTSYRWHIQLLTE